MTTTTHEAVIGLEVHVQVRTASKAFCGCSPRFGDAPNTHLCPVCLGLPGALPVLNGALVDAAVRLGVAVGAAVSPVSRFARKNYFYPDLPKGYQITQAAEPICSGGSVLLDPDEGEPRAVKIAHIHMEEDAGRSVHRGDVATLIDLNRAGVPLLELVTEPVLRTPAEASAVVRAVRELVRHLGISEANMEEGSLRCDANVSLARNPGARSEIKNLNSFRSIERALAYEIARLALLEGPEPPLTLLWDDEREETRAMRSKESAPDYRYLPEPDLPPVLLEPATVDRALRALPELPAALRRRLRSAYALPAYDARVLSAEPETVAYFEAVVARAGLPQAKAAANWVMTEVLRLAGERVVSADRVPVAPEALAELILLIADGTVSGRTAKEVFALMTESGQAASVIVRERGWTQISDEAALSAAVDAALAQHAAAAERCRQGADHLVTFFVGEVMRATQGRANPARVGAILRARFSRP